MLRGAKQEAALCWALGGASLSAAVENGTGWTCWWVHSCLGGGMRGPGDVPALLSARSWSHIPAQMQARQQILACGL